MNNSSDSSIVVLVAIWFYSLPYLWVRDHARRNGGPRGADDVGLGGELAGVTAREVPIGWIGDGLLITRPGDPGSPRGEIYKVDIRTGRQESWKNILPRDPAGIMVLVSFRVTPDGRSQAYTWHRALSNLYVADGLA